MGASSSQRNRKEQELAPMGRSYEDEHDDLFRLNP